MATTTLDLTSFARDQLAKVAHFLSLPSKIRINDVDIVKSMFDDRVFDWAGSPNEPNDEHLWDDSWVSVEPPGFPGWIRMSRTISVLDSRGGLAEILVVMWTPPRCPIPVSIEIRNLGSLPVELVSSGQMDRPDESPMKMPTIEWTRVVTVSPWSGVAWSDHRILLAMCAPHTDAPKDVRDECAKRIVNPDPDSTKDTGSANMEMALPIDLWIERYGKFPESILALEMYRLKQVMRPRQWYDAETHVPKSLVDPKAKFPGWPILGVDATKKNVLWEWFFNAAGLNPGDSMHPDDEEHECLERRFDYPPALEASILFWTLLESSSNNWRQSPDNIGTGAPRVFGWALYRCAKLIGSLLRRSESHVDSHAVYGPIFKRVEGFMTWLLDRTEVNYWCDSSSVPAVNPTPNPWAYGGDSVTKNGKLDYWQDWQFHVLAFGLLRASSALLSLAYANRAMDAAFMASGILKWIDAASEKEGPYAGSTAYIRSVDGSYRVRSPIPGTGSWAAIFFDEIGRVRSEFENEFSGSGEGFKGDSILPPAESFQHIAYAKAFTMLYWSKQPKKMRAQESAVKVLGTAAFAYDS